MAPRYPLNVFLGREVKRSIRAAGIPLGAVAHRIGMPPSTFGRRITGRVGFTVGELGCIAEAIGRDVSIVAWVVAAERKANVGTSSTTIEENAA